jgi:hypothetical protein
MATSTAGTRRVRNESVWLYDMYADQLLTHDGYVIIDSSLGVVMPPAANGHPTPAAHHPVS